MPEFTRVCEKIEGGSIGFAEALERLAAIGDFLLCQRLLRFKFLDLALIGFDDRIVRRFDNPFQKRIHFLFNGANLAFQRLALHIGIGKPAVPQIAEHLEGQMEQPFGGFQGEQERFELAFDLLLADGLAHIGASARIAQIIGIMGASPLRPASRHRLAAGRTAEKAAQGEVLVQVFPRRSLGVAPAALLHGNPSLEADQPLMLALKGFHAPIFTGDIARIDRTVEHLENAFGMDFAFMVFRPCGLRFQIAFDLEHGFKTARRIAFQRFADDGGIRFVAHQHLAMTGLTLGFIAYGAFEWPIAILQTRLHAALCLFGVLLPLMLGDGCQQVFHEDGIGILAKLDGRAFQLAARFAQEVAQVPMAANIAAETADIVDDADIALLAVGFQKRHHRHHGGAAGMTAAHIVAEHVYDLIALHGRVIAATSLLAC